MAKKAEKKSKLEEKLTKKDELIWDKLTKKEKDAVFKFSTVITNPDPWVGFFFLIETVICSPFFAFASMILKSYFFSGIISIDLLSGSPTVPINQTLEGLIVTIFSTSPVIVRSIVGLSGSFVVTVIFFFSFFPPYPLVLTFMVIFPSLPGGICLGNETAVQPQSVFTF